jgi:hypothetical protein
MRRVVGTAVVDDVCVFEEADPTWFVDVALSKDNSLLTINSNDRVSSEVRVLRADRAFDTPRLIAARQQGTQYFVEHNKVCECVGATAMVAAVPTPRCLRAFAGSRVRRYEHRRRCELQSGGGFCGQPEQEHVD